MLLGRRGPEYAAYTAPELLALRGMPGVELIVDDSDPRTGEALDAAAHGAQADLLRGVRRLRPDLAAPPGPGRRIVLRFHSTVECVHGTSAAEGVRLVDGTDVLGAPVVSAIGYGGRAVPGLPFDATTGTTPHTAGRIDDVPGAYAVGWFKRGSTGGIGDNRVDAAETVRTLLGDAVAGRLPAPTRKPRALARSLRRKNEIVDGAGVSRILRAEEARGRAGGRPAAKFATAEELRRVSRRR